MKLTLRGRTAKLGAVGLAAAVVTMFGATTAWAAGTNAGPAVITNPNNVPITTGGSQTPFAIHLPALATCTGDTASSHYHVFGYIVPSTQDVGALTWDANGPVLSSGDLNTLYGTDGTPEANLGTAEPSGQVISPGALNFGNFSINGTTGAGFISLPAGTYNVGIACVTPGQTTDKYWNVQETFAANQGDPNGEVWSTAPGTPVPESPLTVALPVTAVAIIGVGVVVARRRRNSVTTPVS